MDGLAGTGPSESDGKSRAEATSRDACSVVAVLSSKEAVTARDMSISSLDHTQCTFIVCSTCHVTQS